MTIEDGVDEDGIKGYSIVIDIEKGTYETSQLSQEEIIRDYQEDMIENDDEPIDVEEEKLFLHDYQTNNKSASTGILTAFEVKAFTRDPP
ncbi:hypothetical protein [Pseudogracilibacillus sp. SO30301A]|uniref:hypothetical protein n=1 Tax=Pseudogracilibacillus sp. SO30301A TaxID=3098291 RepID=UPI00300E6DBB